MPGQGETQTKEQSKSKTDSKLEKNAANHHQHNVYKGG